jgi:RNA polymerase sigma-70 factor (ECF subfamily)
VRDEDRGRRFQEIVLPHLPSAYNLARWLLRNDHDAEDIVQEAYLRALRFFDGFRGGDGRAWLLTIVRKSCYTWLEKNSLRQQTDEFDERQHSTDALSFTGENQGNNPETLLSNFEDARRLNGALESLPAEFREALVLRELDNLSYKEIAHVTLVPIGTVMSRLARGRKMLMARLKCKDKS